MSRSLTDPGSGDSPLLYVGPHAEQITQLSAGAGFTRVVSADTTEIAVNLVRSESHHLTAALFDASVGSSDLEEVVAYLRRAFPEIVIAIAGEMSTSDARTLELLGVSVEVDTIPTAAQLDALARLASRSSVQKVGKDDWSMKVERGNWVEISVPSKEAYVARIQELVEMLEKTNLDQDTRDELMLAIDELVRNAMEWGNQFDEDRRVIVSYYCGTDRIVIRVEDEGEGFDTSDFKDPTSDLQGHTDSRVAEGKRAGGFGIHLIRNLMDDVIYNEKGNVVVLTKYLNLEKS